MLDFNDLSTPLEAALDLGAERDALKRDLLARLPAVLRTLFPAAKIRGQRGLIGNIQGAPGDSLEMALEGERAGLWHDHATGEGGDLFDAIAAQQGLDTQREFRRRAGGRRASARALTGQSSAGAGRGAAG